jgi:hypothetical protein
MASGMATRFPDADTLDKLVNLCEEDFNAFRSERGVRWENSDTEQENLTFEQILNAKIATTALFFDKETEARKTTLEGYKEYLLPSVFGGRGAHWKSAISDSDCSVLTFNYDRLFEIAFLDSFRDTQGSIKVENWPLYGKCVLNSGFECGLDKRIEIEPDNFCFLKLHGSAGWWARTCATNNQTKDLRDYGEHSPIVPPDLPDLEQFLQRKPQDYEWEPLIAFPHEKQRFTSRHPGKFEQGPYIGKVWEHAAQVLRKATEVTVIGYSFALIDRTHMVENLLCKAPKNAKIRIGFFKDKEAVRHALEGYQDLQDREEQGHLKFIHKIF